MSRLGWVRILIASAIGGLIVLAINTHGEALISLIPAFAAYVLAWTVKEADQ